jgi:hypothetical protein
MIFTVTVIFVFVCLTIEKLVPTFQRKCLGRMAGQLGGVELTAVNVEQAVLQFYRNTGSQVR